MLDLRPKLVRAQQTLPGSLYGSPLELSVKAYAKPCNSHPTLGRAKGAGCREGTPEPSLTTPKRGKKKREGRKVLESPVIKSPRRLGGSVS